MAANTYKVIEIVGTSDAGIEDAIQGAVARASQSLKNLDWFEVREIRGNIQDDKIAWYQVKMGIGFRILSEDELDEDDD